jgi:hypothetical protein
MAHEENRLESGTFSFKLSQDYTLGIEDSFWCRLFGMWQGMQIEPSRTTSSGELVNTMVRFILSKRSNGMVGILA